MNVEVEVMWGAPMQSFPLKSSIIVPKSFNELESGLEGSSMLRSCYGAIESHGGVHSVQ